MELKPFNKLTEKDKELILSMYYSKTSFEDMSKNFGYSDRAVRRVLKELGVNTRLKNRYTLNEDYFEEIDSDDKAYWLGFIYADGYVGDEGINNIIISLTEDDREHLQMFAEQIEFTGNLRSVAAGGYAGSKAGVTINFSSKKMASDLRKIGLYRGKSMTLSDLPDIQPQYLRHFIRGYFDGDGSIYTSRHTSRHQLSDGTLKLYEYRRPEVSMIGSLKFIEKMMKAVPFDFRIKESHTQGMVYMISARSTDIMDIYFYMYNDARTYLKRKFDKWTNILSALGEQSPLNN